MGCRPAVPLGDLLSLARAEGGGACLQGAARKERALPKPDRHRNPTGRAILSRRGTPPALLREASRRECGSRGGARTVKNDVLSRDDVSTSPRSAFRPDSPRNARL